MTRQGKIRINELARELEVKANEILEILPELGVDDKKTHSSSLDDATADQIRNHVRRSIHEALEEQEQPELELPAREPPKQEAPPRTAATATVRPSIPLQGRSSKPLRPPVQVFRPPLRSEGAPMRPPASQGPAPQPPVQAPPTATAPPQPRPPAAAPPAPPAPAPPQPGPPQATRPAAPPPPAPAAPARPPAAPPFQPGAGGVAGQQQPPTALRQPPAAARPAAPGAARPAPPSAARPAAPGAPLPPPVPKIPRARPSEGVVRRPAATAPGAPQPTIRTVRPPQPGAPAPQVRGPRAPLPPGAQQRPAVAPPAPGAPVRPVRSPVGSPAARAARGGAAPQRKAPAIVPGQPIYQRARPNAPVPGMPTPRPGAGPRPFPGRPSGPGPGGPGRPDQRRGRPAPQARKRDPEAERESKFLQRQASARADRVPVKAANTEIVIGEGATVKELAEKLGIKASLIIKTLVERGLFATINQTLDLDSIRDLAKRFGASVEETTFEEETQFDVDLREEPEQLEIRAPIVTVMGHVDHGKTSLLDALRETNVADREAGGITQAIGASQIEHNGRRIVFIDTPGHEAFTRMRAQGAKVTDVVILVVAADDGVMPQTLEAIDHARAGGVPIVVAINKIDKANAQPDRVKQQLADRGLMPEEWGGETIMVPVSATQRQNLEQLLEMVLLVVDVKELRANPNRAAIGTVLEAKLDRGQGPVATVIVQNGTLRIGDYFLVGAVFGKVRALIDARGEKIPEAGPATAVIVLGLEGLPAPGDQLHVVTDTDRAKKIVEHREQKARDQSLAKSSRISLEQLQDRLRAGEVRELRIVLKADVQGSLDVLQETLSKLRNEKVQVQVIHSGVGAVSESDVLLAMASEAVIVGFNVRPERNAAVLAEREKIDIRLHTVIYELEDEIKKALAGLLEPVVKEEFQGRAEVREVFRVTKVGTVAGCVIAEGHATSSSKARLLRDNVVVYTGRVASLRRFKDDVSEVRAGQECGIALQNYNDVKQGDIIEIFRTFEVAQDLGF